MSTRTILWKTVSEPLGKVEVILYSDTYHNHIAPFKLQVEPHFIKNAVEVPSLVWRDKSMPHRYMIAAKEIQTQSGTKLTVIVDGSAKPAVVCTAFFNRKPNVGTILWPIGGLSRDS